MSYLRVAFEPPPYPMSGSYGDGPSLIKDLAGLKGRIQDPEFDKSAARGRLHMFEQWTQDLAAKFAQDTTTAADVIPPGYRALASILLDTDRPFWNAARHAQISSSQPFTVPDFDGTDTTSDHTESAAPSEGTPVIGSQTVTPTPISGKLPLTRELVDQSSPTADQLALAAMVEDFHRQVEAKIYEALKAAQAAGGFSGHVEAGTTDGADGLRLAIANFSLVRGKRPRWAIFDAAEDTFASGLDGSTGDDLSAFREQGVRINPATNTMTSAAGDPRAFVTGADLWSFDSPVLEFRYTEKSGPELVEPAVFGYHAEVLNHDTGLAVVRF